MIEEKRVHGGHNDAPKKHYKRASAHTHSLDKYVKIIILIGKDGRLTYCCCCCYYYLKLVQREGGTKLTQHFDS